MEKFSFTDYFPFFLYFGQRKDTMQKFPLEQNHLQKSFTSNHFTQNAFVSFAL